MPPVPNVKGFPGVYSDDTLSLCKIKDIDSLLVNVLVTRL